MDVDTLEVYRDLINKNVMYYTEEGGEEKYGTLLNIFPGDTNYGEIQRLETQTKTNNNPIIDWVLLENIMPADFPPVNEIIADTDKELAGAGGTLKFGPNTYEATAVEGRKIGDEVVWIRPSEQPLIGRIVWIGGRILANGGRDIVADVQFDQPTNQHPGYLLPPAVNRNIVFLNELLTLKAWKKLYTKPDKKPTRTKSKAKSNFDLDDNGDAAPGGKRAVPRNLDWEIKISPNHFYITVIEAQDQMSGDLFGIKGSNDSSYMDATIFSLFAFNNSLDHILYIEEDGIEGCESDRLKQILTENIIKPLRKKYFVKQDNMRKLRKVLENKNETPNTDIEEFIFNFFNIINPNGLFTYDHGGGDHIHQILLPMHNDDSQKMKYMTVQYLLEGSFEASEVKLQDAPKETFIIKLPVADGKLIPCRAVIPNLTLDMFTILKDTKMYKKKRDKAVMKLHAVICQRDVNFATFVRMDSHDDDYSWVFMDSSSTGGVPEVHIVEDVSRNITTATENLDFGMKVHKGSEPKCSGFNLFRDAYICLYVPQQ